MRDFELPSRGIQFLGQALYFFNKCKGKVFPLRGWMWPGGWLEVYLYSSMTAALEGVSGQQYASAVLYPRERPAPIVQEAGWTPGPVWTGGKSSPTGIRSQHRPSRSQSLCRLSYPGHTLMNVLP